MLKQSDIDLKEHYWNFNNQNLHSFSFSFNRQEFLQTKCLINHPITFQVNHVTWSTPTNNNIYHTTEHTVHELSQA